MNSNMPDFQSLMLPILRLLQNDQQYPLKNVLEALASHFNLSEEDLRIKVPSGQQPMFKNRITWALSYLKNAGLITYPQRGVYKITDEGKQVLQENVDSISISDLKKIAAFRKWQSSYTESNPNPIVTYTSSEERTPDEIVGDSIKLLYNKLALELLDNIKGRTAGEFETFVLRLLNKMGYGSLEERAYEVVGKSGDNGIDGIIYQDQFGIERIYVQAKKWADTKVNSKEIRDFIGALSLKGTNKGVFMTTSYFTDDACKTAHMNPQNRIILINGEQLAELAIKYNVGVQIKAEYQIKTLDNDFFEEL
jgi:restriction system protein